MWTLVALLALTQSADVSSDTSAHSESHSPDASADASSDAVGTYTLSPGKIDITKHVNVMIGETDTKAHAKISMWASPKQIKEICEIFKKRHEPEEVEDEEGEEGEEALATIDTVELAQEVSDDTKRLDCLDALLGELEKKLKSLAQDPDPEFQEMLHLHGVQLNQLVQNNADEMLGYLDDDEAESEKESKKITAMLQKFEELVSEHDPSDSIEDSAPGPAGHTSASGSSEDSGSSSIEDSMIPGVPRPDSSSLSEDSSSGDDDDEVLPAEYTGMIRVWIKKAHHLPSADPMQRADPFVKVLIGSSRCDAADECETIGETAHIRQNLNPEWNAHFHSTKAQIFEHATDITIEVWDKDTISRNDLIGKCFIPIPRSPKRHEVHEAQWIKLTKGDEPVVDADGNVSEIEIEVEYTWRVATDGSSSASQELSDSTARASSSESTAQASAPCEQDDSDSTALADPGSD